MSKSSVHRSAHEGLLRGSSAHARDILTFFAVSALWLIFDQLTKTAVSGFAPGEVIYRSQFGLFNIMVVHNTGGAWGMLSGATVFLGILSLIVCVAIIIFVLRCSSGSSLLTYVSLGLIVAGGLGNAIDRFFRGSVIDFIACAFIDFPVFNVADIGVTAGIALLVLSLVISSRKESHGTSDKR